MLGEAGDITPDRARQDEPTTALVHRCQRSGIEQPVKAASRHGESICRVLDRHERSGFSLVGW